MTAKTTAVCVNGMESPAASSAPPRRPARPNAARSAMPATAGGSTSGSSISVSASALPRNRFVAIR